MVVIKRSQGLRCIGSPGFKFINYSLGLVAARVAIALLVGSKLAAKAANFALQVIKDLSLIHI